MKTAYGPYSAGDYTYAVPHQTEELPSLIDYHRSSPEATSTVVSSSVDDTKPSFVKSERDIHVNSGINLLHESYCASPPSSGPYESSEPQFTFPEFYTEPSSSVSPTLDVIGTTSPPLQSSRASPQIIFNKNTSESIIVRYGSAITDQEDQSSSKY